MARSKQVAEDPLMASNFALREITAVNVAASKTDPTSRDSSVLGQSKGRSANFDGLIGFQGISMPSVTLEMRDVVEGNWPHTHRIPITRMSTDDVVLTQAVFRNSSDFYTWIFQALYGRGAPRRDFAIVHLGRTNIAGWQGLRFIRLLNCLPMSWKPGSDFDANSADVSIEELTIHVERIDLDIGTNVFGESLQNTRVFDF